MRIKKVSSILLCMIITLSSLGNWMNVYAKEDEKNTQDSVTVIACSDYQHPGGNTSGSTTVTNIISQIKAHGYDEADGFLAMGDYDYEYVETAEGIASLKNTVKGAYSELADDRMIFVQGNHDIAGAAGLSASGANDTNEYGVYVIHEDDFPMDGGTDEGVRKVAGELDDYLKAKADAGYEQPIFVVSHVPLHYSTRTRVDGVGKYAQYIFEVLNQRAAEGQTIIYMFGHNHNSWGYDDYLGTGSVYLTEGDELYVGKLGATSAVPTEYELHFTYMNAGYIGYNFSETQGADTTLTMTVFQIEDGLVTVER
ncbi:MAG: metallophosphoesterase, partial [Lachnospira sp.]|nr:metallophosphoesterase [Lachnospira sp.]